MANSNRWGDFKGALANIVASGKVYNTYTNSYAPRNVTATRVGAGVAGQLGPAGTIAGMVAKGINDRGNDAQAFDAGQEGWSNIHDQFSQRPEVSGMALDVPDVQFNTQSQMGSLRGGIAGMVSQGSNYGAYQGGDSGIPFAPPPVADNSIGGFSGGVFAGGQGNFGPQQPVRGATMGSGGMGSSMGGARGAYSQGGITGEAARGMFEGMSDASRFNTNFGYGQALDRNN